MTDYLLIESNSTTINLDYSFDYEKKIQLINYRIPFGIYNISSSLKTNTFKVNGSTVTLEEGCYEDGYNLASQIQSKLQVIDSNYTCTFDNITKKITISNSSISFDLNFDDSNIHIILGFSGNKSSANTHTGDYPINLIPFACIYLQFNNATVENLILSNELDISNCISIPVENQFSSYLKPDSGDEFAIIKLKSNRRSFTINFFVIINGEKYSLDLNNGKYFLKFRVL